MEPCSSGVSQRVSWLKYPRSGTTHRGKHGERRLPIRVRTDWVSHFQDKRGIRNFWVAFPKLTFLSFFPAVISFTIQALSFIFTNLPLAVASVPLPIRYLFQVAEKQLSQHTRQLRLVGLLLWALLGCLIQGLEDPHMLEKISGLALGSGAKEPLSLLAECLQATMGIQQRVRAQVNVITIMSIIISRGFIYNLG